MLNLKIFIALFTLTYGINVFAHPPGLSSADLTLNSHHIDAVITFAVQDIEAFNPMDSDQDAEVTPVEMDAAKPAIAKWVAHEILLTANQQPLNPLNPGTVSFDQQNNAQVHFEFAASDLQQLHLESRFLNKLPIGHKQYLTVKKSNGQVLAEKMLTQDDNSLTLNSSVKSAIANEVAPKFASFIDFLKLGIEHILTGYDHLLFLFSLLVVTRNFWPALKIISCFTVAHSITLALAGFNVVELPGTLVEPLIAVTIMYVAVENLFRGDHPKGREWLTFFFGLIHGFGFASVLREMNIGANDDGIWIPLFSFNLGVELGQITVAAFVLPIIWWLHRNSQIGQRLAPVGSILAGLAGSYWLIERTLLS